MSILITGAAGFIGYHISQHLLNRGESVIGVDDLNPYYDVQLKNARLKQLESHANFLFYPVNIMERDVITSFATKHPDIQKVIHLAAQAGVRYSLKNPYVYANSNLVGHLTILELCRSLQNLQHFVYASSSSVYGANQKLPFSIEDRVDHPISLYAATKRSSELMAYTYSHLYGIPTTGLRYFTAYGPWGRPDMSAFIFTKAILANEEIAVFNHGNMRRNFTYIDDIVEGTCACLDSPPKQGSKQNSELHRIYNIGNNQSESIIDFINILEKTIGKKAKIRFEPMQPGEVKETIADISEATRDFKFIPKTNIHEGLKQFVEWYRSYYGI